MLYERGLKVAVVGVGRWGINHLRALARILGEGHVGFLEEDPARRAQVAAAFPAAVVFDSLPHFLGSDFRAAVIAAPAARHADLARVLLEAGKHALVEKPLALEVADAAEIAARARAGKAVLMVGHTLLYEQAVEKLHQLLGAGALGPIRYIIAARAKLGVIRTAEDVMFSFAAHDVAAVLWLMGETPRSVSAAAVDARGADIYDAAFVNMAFEGGALAHCWASWLHPEKARRLTVVGEKAMAVVDQERPGGAALTLFRKGVRAGTTETFDEGAEEFTFAEADTLEEEVRHFLRCLTTGERPRSDGDQGLAVVKVLAAARKSARAGGAPVLLEGGGA